MPLTEQERDALSQQVAESAQSVAQVWPLKTFAYRNPTRGFEHLPFDEGIKASSGMLGGKGYLPNDEYREFYRNGRITDQNIDRALDRCGPAADDAAAIAGISRQAILRLHLAEGIDPLEPCLLDWTLKHDPPAPDLWQACTDLPCRDREGAVPTPGPQTIGDQLDAAHDAQIIERVNQQMTKWSAAFLDEGLADWGMPDRSAGFYASWRQLAPSDASGGLLGIKNYSQKAGDLPDHPEQLIADCLDRLEIPPESRSAYQARHLSQLPGWTGFIRWRSENPEYPAQHEHPVELVEYLAVRFFYETELVESFRASGREPVVATPGPGADTTATDSWRLYRLARSLDLSPDQVRALTPVDAQTFLDWLDEFPSESHGVVWLEAYEDAYRDQLVANLAAHGPGERTNDRPLAQLYFCIDARSEPFRRHLEAQGPYETLGYAGFFGVAMSHQAFDSHERLALCPVLLKPGHAVTETPRPTGDGPLSGYLSATRWRRLGDELFHNIKANPISSFFLVDLVGLLFSIGLLGKTLVRKPFVAIRARIRRFFQRDVTTEIPFTRQDGEISGLLAGFTLEEQAAFIGGGLRVTGLTENLGRFVVPCGHGAVSENNPYQAAYNCGACGGAHGDPNARVFAAMANRPEVRQALADTGLHIPEDTWFLAAKHDTTTDRIEFYDLVDLPESHRQDLERLQRDLESAGQAQTQERLQRLPSAPRGMSETASYAHAQSRTVDWANPRPEWGLSSNAAFVIGRRQMSAGVDLGARSFLHSYDPDSDPEGALLEKIMTAPLIVTQWINMEYYFSAVDPWFYGSGSKVIHNVVGGVGVMLGSSSDLKGGLPLQGVNDGETHYHEPMRLHAVIEAPRDRVGAIIAKHEVLQTIFHNRWMNLLTIDPDTREFYRYQSDASWEAMAQAA